MITKGLLGAALTLLLGCAANPEPAPMSAMNMNMSMEPGMGMDVECPMHAMHVAGGDMQMMQPSDAAAPEMQGMQCPAMQGMQMPNAPMPGEACPCPGCAAAQDQPAP